MKYKKIGLGLLFAFVTNIAFAFDTPPSLSDISITPGFIVFQPIYRNNEVSLRDGSNFLGRGRFNNSYPNVGMTLRFQSGPWFIQPFIGGPTMSDETAIYRRIGSSYNGFAKVSLERTVYGGFIIGRDLFMLDLSDPFESSLFISSVESSVESYESSLTQAGLVFGLAGGLRVVGDELRLEVNQGMGSPSQTAVDDDVVVEGTAQAYVRYKFPSDYEISMGVEAGYKTGRSARDMGGFFSAESEEDVDVNFFAQVAYTF